MKMTIRVGETQYEEIVGAALDRSHAERAPVAASELVRRGIARELREVARGEKYRKIAPVASG